MKKKAGEQIKREEKKKERRTDKPIQSLLILKGNQPRRASCSVACLWEIAMTTDILPREKEARGPGNNLSN